MDSPTVGSEATVASDTDIGKFLGDEEEEAFLRDANLKKYTEWNDKRNEERATFEAEMERTIEFNIGHSLRTEWAGAQAKDRECLEILKVLKPSSIDDIQKREG